MDFKKGDWVRVQKSDKGYKIKNIHQGRYFFDDTLSVFCKHDLEKWEPRDGEWIITSFGNENAVITKFSSNAKYCEMEPFKGKFPSFLKELHDS